MATSWKTIFGGLDDIAPVVIEVLRELESDSPGVHTQESIKNALALRLISEFPDHPSETTHEHAQNIVAHMQSQWSKQAGLGNRAKEAKRPDPIMFSPQWLADFSAEWGRRPGRGDKWDVYRRPNENEFWALSTPTADHEELERRTARLLEYPLGKPPGERTPKRVTVSAQSCFERRPEVKAWVLQQAEGRCECCQDNAPFTRSDGSPYLEVHHAVPLAVGGPDTVDNAIAVCPNCHRRLHHGHDRADLLARVYEQVSRLATLRD